MTSTLNGNDVTDKDSYTFALSAADTANGWYIDADKHTLKNDNIPVMGAVTLTATVTSANSGNTKTQALTLNVAQNSAIIVDWVKTTVPMARTARPLCRTRFNQLCDLDVKWH